jgi:hypothetical protein
MAEAFLNTLGRDDFKAESAGFKPSELNSLGSIHIPLRRGAALIIPIPKLRNRKLMVGCQEHPLNRHSERTGFFTGAGAFFTCFCVRARNSCVFFHGFTLPSLSIKIMIEAQYGVNRHSMKAGRLTQPARMAAVQMTAALLVLGKHCPVIHAEPLS